MFQQAAVSQVNGYSQDFPTFSWKKCNEYVPQTFLASFSLINKKNELFHTRKYSFLIKKKI